MPLALLALAVSAFGIGTTEFVMMGLLPNVADDLHTSVPTAGYLVSAYAIGVVLGAPLLTGLGSRVPRKKMLLLLMAVFTVGNLASALAPDFGWLIAGRLLAGLPHGAFFGVGAVVAARLVTEGRQARAVATMFLGLTVANIVGVPAATLLGQHLGWRATFLVVAAIGLAAMAALARLVPHIPVEAHQDVRRELRALGNRQVVLGLLTAVFGFAGVFAVYSYLSTMTTKAMGFGESSVTPVLALFGIGMTLGALAAGPLTDRALRPTLYGSLGALAVVLAVFPFVVHVTWAALVIVVLLGAVGFMTTTPLQMLVMNKAKDAPTLASASNHSAFNLANAGGAWLGGVAIAAGWGWTSPAFVGAALAVAGLAIAMTAGYLDRTPNPNSRVVAGGPTTTRDPDRKTTSSRSGV
ncbi:MULTISPECIES: MFS transporter [Streptomyces]|uniref:MFS transporter n=1 Tax=Streptomyces californicus TaxID=67351 RepID=A0ABD7D398_9ACTN|nr:MULTISPECIES: MFS transporter [Streptomyces]MYW81915.1 MFS transporter [Streptomyces sp. SID8369]NEA08191.1 MFS transporter [Streptomyces sp. SID10692]KOU05288.1 MFS transporter [Streptomyces sp. NRRL F-2295]MCC0579561.1 MFS transporter [Streptomyces californicus]MDP9948905.1 DHA1 family inner membrane transport protein [Streptomyces sp. DSM 41269]